MMFGSCIEIWKKRSFQQITTLLINAFTYSTHSAARIPKKENRSVILLNADSFIFASLNNRIVITACRIFNLSTRWTLLTSARKAFPIGNHDQSG